MAMMLISSYLVYFSMEDAGERLGEESPEYKAAMEKYTDTAGKINGGDIEALRDFCNEYSLSELAYRKNALLLRYGYSNEEYENYKATKKASEKRAIRIFKRAERLRAVSIAPGALLSKERSRTESELKSPERTKFISMIIKLIPCTVSMGVTVSLMLSTKENMCAATVIDGLLKLSSLPIIGFKGYAAGYAYMSRSMTGWLGTKARLLGAFLEKERQIDTIH